MQNTKITVFNYDAKKYLNKVLFCVEPFLMFKYGDLVYCFACTNEFLICYSNRYEMEFKIHCKFINNFITY